MSGVLVVDKPRGPTSHDVVAELRRALGTKRVGHCGTLDPMATGVLVVAIDEGTKLVPWLTADDKSYEATILLGVATDSLDADGAETERVAISEDVRAALGVAREGSILARAIATEAARTSQVPPAVSAIRVDGKRAHVLARRGEAPEMAAREVAVRRIEVLGVDLEPAPCVRVAIDVSKGYYVRAFARDLAAALGTVGHLTALRRTRSGAFTEGDAVALDDPARFGAALLSLEEAAARAMPTSVLDLEGVRAARFGQKVAPSSIEGASAAPSAWFDQAGKLVAVGAVEPDGFGRVIRGFVG